MGQSTEFSFRLSIHFLSLHSNPFISATTDAVLGRSSLDKAYGSDLISMASPCVCTSNLYLWPAPTHGTKSSQTPELPRQRMGFALPSQWLKSATSDTAFAPGAQRV